MGMSFCAMGDSDKVGPFLYVFYLIWGKCGGVPPDNAACLARASARSWGGFVCDWLSSEILLGTMDLLLQLVRARMQLAQRVLVRGNGSGGVSLF